MSNLPISPDEIIDIDLIKPKTAMDYIVSLKPFVPMSTETPGKELSNGEIRRLLDQSAIMINGKKPKSKEIIEFPVTSLVWFPKNHNKRVTML